MEEPSTIVITKTDHPPKCNWIPPQDELITYIFFNILFSTLVISSNLVFLLAVAKTPALQSISNFFLCSLAVADFAAGVFVNPLYSCIIILEVSPSGHWVSKVEKFVWIQSLVSTTFSLVLVSVDRYVAVLYPLKYYNIVTKQRCLFSIISVWVISVILALPAPFISEKGVAILWSCAGVISVIIPFIIISFCYSQIFKAVKHQERKVNVELSSVSVISRSEMINLSAKHHQKTALTTAIIVLCFVLLFTPNFVMAFLYAFAEEGCDQDEVLRPWLWAVLVAHSGSFINPWIYALRSKEFRNVFKQMFRVV